MGFEVKVYKKSIWYILIQNREKHLKCVKTKGLV